MTSSGSSRRLVRGALLVLQLTAAAGTTALAATSCGAATEECIPLPESCVPSLSTDYNTIYRSVLMPRCGTGVGVLTCHGPTGNQGGLTLADPDGAYNSLLGVGSAHARVIPGDPSCSPLMARLTSADASLRMPKGEAPLGEGIICTIQSWIREGASR